ncbi:hypothetical protein H180DRAFT_01514 [Streptomyces sp. WMMB 322]|nr:hypothetical protein H180DRAFT_01514 [Streptomyces sp. WMMB 322]
MHRRFQEAGVPYLDFHTTACGTSDGRDLLGGQLEEVT